MALSTVSEIANDYAEQINVVVKDVPKAGLDYAVDSEKNIDVNFSIPWYGTTNSNFANHNCELSTATGNQAIYVWQYKQDVYWSNILPQRYNDGAVLDNVFGKDEIKLIINADLTLSADTPG